MCIKLRVAYQKNSLSKIQHENLIHKHTTNNGHVSAINSVKNVYFSCSLIYEKTLRSATLTVIGFHFQNFSFIPRYEIIKVHNMLS